ncbi:MAG: peptidase M61 [Polaromonas sp. 39-63-203]|nr:MAG: peptidase M61 [Polaromonas sp. 39-63-203]
MTEKSSAPALSTDPIHYRVDIDAPNTHRFRVTLTGLQARQGRSPRVVTRQLDKCTWQIECSPTRPLVVSYEVYARDNSVRAAWLDADRGFFNGTSLCLRVEGQEQAAHSLEVPVPKAVTAWSLATGLTPQRIDKRGFGTYVAGSYDELVDCPVEMGAFWSGTFTACGVPHRFVVRFWHGGKPPPFARYLFMLNAVDDGYGGLEHRNSTALICNRKDLPRTGELKVSEGYTTLRGLISHEYFHTWNVKRLRPAAFENYDYERENYTPLLWFFEGFTSYYDDLLLRRAGLLDNAGYLKLLNKTINQVMQSPGRLVQSVAEASFDAWVKYYRQDENTPNVTVSYYTKGALVAMCFDLTLRDASGHDATLDDAMRALWVRCKAGPMTEADFAGVLETLGHRSFAPELAQWVHGRDELPLKSLLVQHGVGVLDEPAQLAHRLGLRVTESQGVQIKTVLRGGAAERAGFAPGDEWLGVEPWSRSGAAPAGGWRMGRLDDLNLYAGSARKVTALVARDQRLIRLELDMPPAMNTWRLVVQDAALLERWLNPNA